MTRTILFLRPDLELTNAIIQPQSIDSARDNIGRNMALTMIKISFMMLKTCDKEVYARRRQHDYKLIYIIHCDERYYARK